MVFQYIRNFIRRLTAYCYPILIALSLFIVAASSYYYYKQYSVPQQALNLVTTLAKNRMDRLENFLQRQISFTHILASHKTIQETLGNIPKATEDSFSTLKVFLEEAGNAENYYNTLLADAQGRVIFSNFSENYVGVDLFKKPESESPLGSGMLRSRMMATYDVTSFNFDPILKQPALFVVVPVYTQGNLIGFVAQKLLNQAIYNIIQDYLSLGPTGDISVGIKNHDGIIFIDQSRSLEIAPFKRFISNDSLVRTTTETLLSNALLGYQNRAIFNEKNQPAAFAWNYIPIVDWAMVTVQPLNDFLKGYHFLTIFMLIAFVIFMIIVSYKACTLKWFSAFHNYILTLWHHKHNKIRAIQILISILLLVSGITIYLLTRDIHTQLNTMKNNAQKITQHTKEKTIALIKNIERVGASLEYDLTQEIFNKKDLIERVKRDLLNHPQIYGITVAFEPYAYAENQRLYAPYVVRKDNEFIINRYDEIYDYTQIKVASESSWPWYIDPIKTGKSEWFDPYWEKISGDPVLLVSYSVPFYAKNDIQRAHPIGIINITVEVSHIQKYVARIFLGSTGYGLMFSSNGTLLYYPQKKYVVGNETITALARQEGNKELFVIATKILAGKNGFYSYNKPSGDGKEWLYTEKIDSTQWILGTVFSETETVLSILSIRHYCFALLILIMLFVIFVFFSLSKHFWEQHYLTKLLTFILIIGQICLLVTIRFTPAFELKPNVIKITDQTYINKYVEEAQEYAKNINEPEPQSLAFGLYISSVRFTNSSVMELTGYLWEKLLTTQDKSLLKEPVFTQAIKLADFKKVYETQDNGTSLICWKFFVQLSQKLNYAQYPFDAIKIGVELEHPDYAKNVILTPLLQSYSDLPFQKELPALSNLVTLSGFTIKDAFFAFNETQPMRLGVENLDAPYKTQTIYEIHMVRNLMYDFIVFILPLLIIYFILYSIMVITIATHKTKDLFTLSAYTGLIFVAIVLHRALREQYLTGGILYLEYLFFLLYISFILIVLYTSLDLQDSFFARLIRNTFYIFQEFFWPIQLTALFIITLLSFYKS